MDRTYVCGIDPAVGKDYTVLIKRCGKCGKELPLENFYKCSKDPSGRQCYCKNCHDEHKKNETIKNPKQVWCYKTRSNHSKKGYNVIITNDELYNIIYKKETCDLCGCTLDWSLYTKGSSKPNSPTLDRINNSNDITKDNVMILCHECNSMKRSKSLDELISFCKMVMKKYGTN